MVAVFSAFAAQLQLPVIKLLRTLERVTTYKEVSKHTAVLSVTTPNDKKPAANPATKSAVFVSLSPHFYTMPYAEYFASMTPSPTPPAHLLEE